MNRLQRVTTILIQLQSKKIVKAQDIAERFNVSLRTVYRDIKTLEEAGVPILGETGIGYSIMVGYRLPPVMFTKEEATAFLTAEKIMEKFTDASTQKSYKSGMYKVRAVLRSTEKDMLENIEDHIEVFRKAMPYDDASVNDTLQTLLKSISEKRVLHIHYEAFNSNEITKRDIEPIGVYYANGYWHAIAFCQLRNDYRDFRTDRISRMLSTDRLFFREHPPLKTYLEEVSKNQELQMVVINVETDIAKFLAVQKYYYGFVKEEKFDHHIQMTFLTPYSDSFERWYITFADHAEVISPDLLKHKVKELVCRIQKKIF